MDVTNDATLLKFQGGGTLGWDAYYLPRTADQELFDGLVLGKTCCLLAPRQVGKSSLQLRTERRLQAEGISCALIDIRNASTRDASANTWYRGIAKNVARELNIVGEFDAFWSASSHAPEQQWMRFLHDYIPAHTAGPTVIFFDETDSVLSLPFEFDDFFAAIRSVYNARPRDERLRRLTFCLIGVLSTSDLLKDPDRTPFNVAELIRLEDFKRHELEPLTAGLNGLGVNPGALLDEIYGWTSGHPYMTQKLCEILVKRGPMAGTAAQRVASVVRDFFLKRNAQWDENVRYAAARLTTRPRSTEMLELYRRVLNQLSIPARALGPIEEELWLAGVISERVSANGASILQVRNRVFGLLLDNDWLDEQERKRELWEPLWAWEEHNRHPDYLLSGNALARQMDKLKASAVTFTQKETQFILASIANHAATPVTPPLRRFSRTRWVRSVLFWLLFRFPLSVLV